MVKCQNLTPTLPNDVLTHPKIFPKPLTLGRAVLVLEEMLDYYRIQILDEATDWWKGLIQIEKNISGIRGNEIFDARIALCLKAAGAKRIFTSDADFKKYDFLKTINYNSQY